MYPRVVAIHQVIYYIIHHVFFTLKQSRNEKTVLLEYVLQVIVHALLASYNG